MKKIISIIIIGILISCSFVASGLSWTKPVLQQSSKLNEYDMVIIAPNCFIEEIQPLIDHKNNYGVFTFLKTTEEIYSDYQGKDKAEQIKYFIKDAIENYNISYVLLIGGHKGQTFKWYIPVRIVHLADGARYTEYVSDLYYADIYKQDQTFEDWNSNGDNVIAEWGNDDFDLKPDIAVGRLPCRSVSEVKGIVNKIIEYETSSFDPSWFKNVIVAGGDTIPDSGNPFPYEGEDLCDEAVSIMDDFTPTKLYTSDLSLVDHDDFIDAWNQGCGFAFYSGRAGPNSLLTFDVSGTPITPLHSNQIKKLTNSDKYPIFIINGCLSGKFDVTIFNFIKFILMQPNIQLSDIAWDCIGWDIVKKENCGAIASIAPTSQCWVGFGDRNNNSVPDMIEMASGFLSLEFLRAYVEKNYTVLGDLYVNAIENYVDTFPVYVSKVDCKTVQEYGIIGDPSLKIGGYQNN